MLQGHVPSQIYMRSRSEGRPTPRTPSRLCVCRNQHSECKQNLDECAGVKYEWEVDTNRSAGLLDDRAAERREEYKE